MNVRVDDGSESLSVSVTEFAPTKARFLTAATVLVLNDSDRMATRWSPCVCVSREAHIIVPCGFPSESLYSERSSLGSHPLCAALEQPLSRGAVRRASAKTNSLDRLTPADLVLS